VSELDQCIDYMSVPGAGCAGLGGTIAWIDTGNAVQMAGQVDLSAVWSSAGCSVQPAKPVCYLLRS